MALRLFLEEADLVETAQRLIDAPDGNPELRSGAYKALCEQVLTAHIPPAVMAAVTPISDKLLAGASHGLAVRSSGVQEDSTTASFAGVYDSFLGLRSVEDIWMAVRRCWCGSWSPQAIDYARKMGIALEVDGMAVMLQMLVNPDSAGVLFTADPQTGNPWRFVSESSFGLARDLVASAGATPVDRFLFEWDTGEILDRDITPKKTALVPGENGIDKIDIPQDRQATPSLSDEQAKKIAQVGLQIDRAFEARVDVEWVVEGDDIHIVQVRPITALPAFFPHCLPAHLADRTWRPAPQWQFWFRPVDVEGKVTPPLYRDKLITEMFNRYLQVGPVEMPAHRLSGAELDFHGHRYLIEDEHWPRVPAAEREQYLKEYEPRMRADFLHDIYTRYPASEQRAMRLANGAKTIEHAIDAILWAREEMWEYYAMTAGPSQGMFGTCFNLLRAFVDEHLPDIDVNDLMLGHHAELDPYFPHVLVSDAEGMAQLLEPERDRFEDLSVSELIETLIAGNAPSSFIAALEDYCERSGSLPPSQFETDVTGEESWETIRILRLIHNAFIGGRRITEINEKATRRREAVVIEARKALAVQPDTLARFERLHDWALFWGPALNQRARGNVTGLRLSRLFRQMQRSLQAAGLVDNGDHIFYFSAEDLMVIAATGDIEAGRRLLQHRRLEYERWDRLRAPAFLGKVPEDGSVSDAQVSDAGDNAAESGAVIVGRPGGPGRNQGIVRRIENLEEGDYAGEEDVVVIVNPIQSNTHEVPFLFSMMLRVRGIVVLDDPMMWMHHVGQIARECRVPIVLVAHSDIVRIVDGCRIDVDGTRGEVTLLDA